MIKFLAIATALLVSASVQALSNFVQNPFSAYAPGCLVGVEASGSGAAGYDLPAFFDQTLPLMYPLPFNEYIPDDWEHVRVMAWRHACPGGSSLLRLRLQPTYGAYFFYRLQAEPQARARLEDGSTIPLKLASTPSAWNLGLGDWGLAKVFDGPWDVDNRDLEFNFLVEALSPLDPGFDTEAGLFNMDVGFTLELSSGDTTWQIVVPQYEVPELQSDRPNQPLAGQLSGPWVVAGTSDQGIDIAISELPVEDFRSQAALMQTPLILFLAWHSYGPNREQIWLSGAGQFVAGATDLEIELERVSGGEFMASKPAHREAVGRARLSALDCETLRLDYSLDAAGLGNGSSLLKRPGGWEIAGYACAHWSSRAIAWCLEDPEANCPVF